MPARQRWHLSLSDEPVGPFCKDNGQVIGWWYGAQGQSTVPEVPMSGVISFHPPYCRT
ncbi:hypothetical protein GCM10009733_087390 [Nonomuraea maheshkhaliensis]|uniref:Uncharacterized protein n=1 Tax=Nonomuraea maheshkhaliensis TaxID=419590 RepID=A0ABP4SR78_9ACTN